MSPSEGRCVCEEVAWHKANGLLTPESQRIIHVRPDGPETITWPKVQTPHEPKAKLPWYRLPLKGNARLDRAKSIYGHVCFFCGGKPVNTDHLHPVSKGGRSTICNLVPACYACNSIKSNRLPTKIELLKAYHLFEARKKNPKQPPLAKPTAVVTPSKTGRNTFVQLPCGCERPEGDFHSCKTFATPAK